MLLSAGFVTKGRKSSPSDVPKKMQVGSRTLKGKAFIAEGGFSYVFLVKDTSTKEYFALKRMICTDQEQLAHAIEEVAIQKSIPPHENIVKLVDIEIEHDKKGTSVINILLEHMSGGRLIDVMKARSKKFPESELLDIFMTVAVAVQHLHWQSPPIAHRDVKIENVLLHEDGTFKLCDFGSCSTNHGSLETQDDIDRAGVDIVRNTTPTYRAPEMVDLHSKREIGPKVDMWALGCLLYKMAFYRDAFEEGKPLLIMSGSINIPPDSPYSEGLHSLIGFLLTVDPIHRPDATAVVQRVAELRATPWQVEPSSSTTGGSSLPEPQLAYPNPPVEKPCTASSSGSTFASATPAGNPVTSILTTNAATNPFPAPSPTLHAASPTLGTPQPLHRRRQSADLALQSFAIEDHQAVLKRAASHDSVRLAESRDDKMRRISMEIEEIRTKEENLARRRKKLEYELLQLSTPQDEAGDCTTVDDPVLKLKKQSLTHNRSVSMTEAEAASHAYATSNKTGQGFTQLQDKAGAPSGIVGSTGLANESGHTATSVTPRMPPVVRLTSEVLNASEQEFEEEEEDKETKMQNILNRIESVAPGEFVPANPPSGFESCADNEQNSAAFDGPSLQSQPAPNTVELTCVSAPGTVELTSLDYSMGNLELDSKAKHRRSRSEGPGTLNFVKL